MQLLRALLNIACELLNRIIAVSGLLRIIALMQADNVPVDKIEGGDDGLHIFSILLLGCLMCLG